MVYMINVFFSPQVPELFGPIRTIAEGRGETVLIGTTKNFVLQGSLDGEFMPITQVNAEYILVLLYLFNTGMDTNTNMNDNMMKKVNKNKKQQNNFMFILKTLICKWQITFLLTRANYFLFQLILYCFLRLKGIIVSKLNWLECIFIFLANQ